MQVTRGLVAGGIFFAIGASATFIASDYRTGTIVRMGPGFLPVAIGCVIALIGALLIVQELLTGNKTDPVELVHLRPLVVFQLAVMASGLLLPPSGRVICFATDRSSSGLGQEC